MADTITKSDSALVKESPPAKPLNSYALFAREERDKMLKKDPQSLKGAGVLVSHLGRAWRNLEDKQIKYYEELAQIEKTNYEKELHDYIEKHGIQATSTKKTKSKEDTSQTTHNLGYKSIKAKKSSSHVKDDKKKNSNHTVNTAPNRQRSTSQHNLRSKGKDSSQEKETKNTKSKNRGRSQSQGRSPSRDVAEKNRNKDKDNTTTTKNEDKTLLNRGRNKSQKTQTSSVSNSVKKIKSSDNRSKSQQKDNKVQKKKVNIGKGNKN